MNSFLSEQELGEMGFKSIGNNCKISRNANFYSPQSISIGDNVRIDDFCIISGNVEIGSNIHISAYVALYGLAGIVLEDYTGISARSTIYSEMDDFSGDYLVGPIHGSQSTNRFGGRVTLKKYSQICAHSVVFPGVTVQEGSVIGACSMVNSDIESWSVYAGIPAKKIKERRKGLLKFIDE